MTMYTWQVKPHVWEVEKRKAIAMGVPYERDIPAINGPMPGDEVARDVEFCGWLPHQVDVREAPEVQQAP